MAPGLKVFLLLEPAFLWSGYWLVPPGPGADIRDPSSCNHLAAVPVSRGETGRTVWPAKQKEVRP
jgi:hypothetical protein